MRAERAHEKARMLASEAIDAELEPADATWLADHLGRCDDCAAVAAEYRALHDELRALPLPEPPRDLWARTAAALDEVDGSAARRASRTGVGGRWLGSLNWTRSSLASVMAVALVVVVVGLSLFSQGPLFAPAPVATSTSNVAVASAAPASAQAPVAVEGGNSIWVASGNGVYEIKSGTTVCTGSPDSCAVSNGSGTVLGSVTSNSTVSVVIGPKATRAAVWNANKVVILPLATSRPATVAIDQLTPRPTGSQPTPSTASPATTASAGPSDNSNATQPPATVTAPPTAPAAAAAQPTAILDGFHVVGRAPEFSADGQWVAFSARQVGAGSGSDVFVWHVGWERAQAITAGHSDLFAGWLGRRMLITEFAVSRPAPTATAAPPEQTAAPSSAPSATTAAAAPAALPLPAGPAVTVATSYVYDPTTHGVQRIDRQMLMPVADPMGRYIVYWSGTVRFDPASGLWLPGQGDFYFDVWANLHPVAGALDSGIAPAPTPQPTAAPTDTPAPSGPTDSAAPSTSTDAPSADPIAPPTTRPSPPSAGQAALPQILALSSRPGTLASWSVRWDGTGQYMAIWVANPGSADIGHVTLFNVIPGQNLLNVDGVLLSTSARSNIQFDNAQFVYTSPAQGGDGKTYLFALPGVPPTPEATQVATATPAIPSSEPPASDAAPASSDRPGS
jgi:hypothetical protein